MKWVLLILFLLPACYANEMEMDKLQLAKNKIEELENIGEACNKTIEKHRATIREIEEAIADLEKTNEDIKLEIQKIARENKLAGYGVAP